MGSHLPMPQRQWDRRRSRKGSMRCHPTAPPTTLPNTFLSAGEIEAQGKESNFSKNAEQCQVPQSEGCQRMGFLLYVPSLVPILALGEREKGRQGIFLARVLGDSMGPLLSGRKTIALNRPDNALLSTLYLRVLPDRSGVGRF